MTNPSDLPGDPLSHLIAPNSLLSRAAFVAARPVLASVLGLPDLQTLYARTRMTAGEPFATQALRALEIRLTVSASPGAAIPPRGPLIVVVNHPTGLLDGLAVFEGVRQVRPDVRIVANRLLACIPELRASSFFVNPFGGAAAARQSARGLRAAHRWLREGGALIVFPAGEVAWKSGRDVPWAALRVLSTLRAVWGCARGVGGEARVWVESEWLPTAARLALSTGAQLLPVHLSGRNSPLFYAAGYVHPRLRTMLLGRELLRKRGNTVHLRIGHIHPATISDARSTPDPAAALTAALRQATEDLGRGAAAVIVAPAVAVNPRLLQRDVSALGNEHRLLSSGPFDVFCATAADLPHVLPEIGRLREVTFRAVGEGTGRAEDLDAFDRYYRHLFVWQRERREVVGAYRLGEVQAILPAHGISGLYTSTLFEYDDRLLEQLGVSLELGRSFVRLEYQRTYHALLLLWQGIGRFVARSPRYRVLFGPVSISSRYNDRSQQMLRAFLAREYADAALAALVVPRHPPPPLVPPVPYTAAGADLAYVRSFVAGIERGEQDVPVLLRQYLRLNARFLGFNIDRAFGGALDALMMVDLATLPEKTLRRYMGSDAAKYLSVHAAGSTPPEAAGLPSVA